MSTENKEIILIIKIMIIMVITIIIIIIIIITILIRRRINSLNLRIQSEYRKIRTRNNSVFGHFSRSDD